MHIKLLALDIDGTLVTTEKNIPAGNKTAIRRFMKRRNSHNSLGQTDKRRYALCRGAGA